MKIFISQPMRNKTQDQIESERSKIMDFARAEYGDDVREIASYLGPNAKFDPLECLGLSIQMMNKADVVIFVPGWEEARGCRIERLCAEMYGKEIVELYFDGVQYMKLFKQHV